jgi:hypothetical protein
MRKVVLTLGVLIGLSLGNLYSTHTEAAVKPVSLDTSIGGEPSTHPVPRTLPAQEQPLEPPAPEPTQCGEARVVFVYIYPSQP